MELSCKTEYALLALLEMVRSYHQSEPLQVRHIAAQQQIPDRYLEQLMATLRRAGIVKSIRGAKGGYILAQEPRQINLLEVVFALEGGESLGEETSLVDKTAESLVIGEIKQELYQSSVNLLRCYNLQDLWDRRNAIAQVDSMYYI